MATKDNLISPDVLGFDPDALAKRYAVERDKRIRADAEEQFVQLSHDSPFTNKYVQEDPYCKPLDRAPLKDQREVIIGGGWVGMLTAARLAEAGITDVRIVEEATAILVVRGIGIATPAHSAISSHTVIFRCWRNRLCSKTPIFLRVRDLRARAKNRQTFRSL